MNAILKKQMFSSYLNMYKFFPKHFYTMRSYSGQGINKKKDGLEQLIQLISSDMQ